MTGPAKTRRAALVVTAMVVLGAFVPSLTACGATRVREAPRPFAVASSETVAPSPAPTPRTVVTEVVETQAIAFERVAAEDPAAPRGQVVVTPGADGVRTVTYRVTTVDGRETERSVVSDVVTLAAVAEVTTTGTYDTPAPAAAPAAAACNPNYADACVPNDSDVDCAGGSGNGPSYLVGQARVVGVDVYDLDRDDNGVACD